MCRADTGRKWLGRERTGLEREQGVHFHQRKEAFSKGEQTQAEACPG